MMRPVAIKCVMHVTSADAPTAPCLPVHCIDDRKVAGGVHAKNSCVQSESRTALTSCNRYLHAACARKACADTRLALTACYANME